MAQEGQQLPEDTAAMKTKYFGIKCIPCAGVYTVQVFLLEKKDNEKKDQLSSKRKKNYTLEHF